MFDNCFSLALHELEQVFQVIVQHGELSEAFLLVLLSLLPSEPLGAELPGRLKSLQTTL